MLASVRTDFLTAVLSKHIRALEALRGVLLSWVFPMGRPSRKGSVILVVCLWFLFGIVHLVVPLGN